MIRDNLEMIPGIVLASVAFDVGIIDLARGRALLAEAHSSTPLR